MRNVAMAFDDVITSPLMYYKNLVSECTVRAVGVAGPGLGI